jgi:hypothetical protein
VTNQLPILRHFAVLQGRQVPSVLPVPLPLTAIVPQRVMEDLTSTAFRVVLEGTQGLPPMESLEASESRLRVTDD